MNKKYSLLALLFSVVLLAGCTADQLSDKSGDAMDKADLPETIKIGFIGPLTGNAAAYGQDIKRGLDIYFEENPTIGESAVEVIYEDGKCNGQDAANAAQKLVNVDKVQAIIGGQCSGETLAAAPIAEQGKVLLLSPLSSSPDVTTAGDYVFRNYPSDSLVSKTLVDFVLERQQKVALLTEQTDYAQGYRESIKGHMEAAERGDDLVVDEAFAVDNSDFKTLLTKVAESEADGLIFVGQSPVVSGFAKKQARELGLEVQFYGTDTTPGTDFFDTAKDAAEGMFAVYVSEDPSRNGYAEFNEKAGPSEAADVFRAFGYDAAQLVAEAIAEVGYDGTMIKDHFNDMGTFKGIASDVTFDENGDNNVAAGVQVAKDGEFVPYTGEAMEKEEGDAMEEDGDSHDDEGSHADESQE